MPGVPHEMKGMMTDTVIPALHQHFKFPFISHRTLLTAGIGESFLADYIRTFEEAPPPSIKLAYLPNYGMVRLRLTIHGDDAPQLESLIQQQFDTLKGLVAEWMVTDEDISIQEAIGRLLKARGKTLGTAESCTGGHIAHLITTIPGSSEYFNGSVVSYANSVKENVLGVSPDTLAANGAVSEPAVEEMVKGAIRLLDVDYAIATSGIMGPGGGSPEKPVGTVWIAVGNRQGVLTQKFNFRFDRGRNIELAATNAMNLLRKFILSND
ncbi:nicotinamide-nucleotide amidohydrolase family protein [Puia sp. P3]|uniref:nicotinamide-nucleotide amidohydrolase family protein n=1 Tax=Puia sp. P3 TaxID=3423952 RepID=UPI003D671436